MTLIQRGGRLLIAVLAAPGFAIESAGAVGARCPGNRGLAAARGFGNRCNRKVCDDELTGSRQRYYRNIARQKGDAGASVQ